MPEIIEIIEKMPFGDASRPVVCCDSGLPDGESPASGWNQVALDMVVDSVMFFSSPNLQVVEANRAAVKQLGYSQDQLKQMSLLELAPRSEWKRLSDSVEEVVSGNLRHVEFSAVYQHSDGSPLPVNCSIRALQQPPHGLFVAVARGVEACDDRTKATSDVAVRDHFTGLPNRTWFLRRVERDIERARRSDYRFAVLFADVDRFKLVNDSYGHLAGDEVLQAVASRLAASVRPDDAVARYGGDEFVVLLSDVGSADVVRAVAERIGCSAVVSGGLEGGAIWQVRITVSVGASICDSGLSSALQAVERADRAMYRAKALGRNGQFVIDDRQINR